MVDEVHVRLTLRPSLITTNDGFKVTVGGGKITSVKARELVCGVAELSRTVTVNVVVPAFTGIPDNAPLVFKVRPLGSAPAVTRQLKGTEPPLAVNTKPP